VESFPIEAGGTPRDFTPLTFTFKIAHWFQNGKSESSNGTRIKPLVQTLAVSGGKSATGLPILANDPHLTLRFASTVSSNHQVLM
jgi:penicillin amidase